MTRNLTLAAVLLAASTGLASAQTPPPPPGGAMPAAPGADMPPPPPGAMKMHGEHRGPGGPDGPGGPEGRRGGPDGPDGPRGPRPDGTGFHLMIGDRMVKVDCGMEPLKGCIEASRPLIDMIGSDGAARGPGTPPPAGDLMTPPAPPAPAN